MHTLFQRDSVVADMKGTLKTAVSRGKYAAIGAAIGAGVGGLVSRQFASTGGALGGLAGAVVGEACGSDHSTVAEIKEKLPSRS